jgi:hypothetical protein
MKQAIRSAPRGAGAAFYQNEDLMAQGYADTLPIAALRPAGVEETLDCMTAALAYFHERDDYRAVFLAAYRVITTQMQTAIRSTGHPFFHDPQWMSRVVGTFATLYFRSLRTFERPFGEETAWKLAHGLAISKSSTVLQDVLLGVNAHIKYDLPVALEQNLYDAAHNQLELSMRRRDHERANLLLARSITVLRSTIPHTYGGSLSVFDRGMLRVDVHVADMVGRYNRWRVWTDAVSLLRAPSAARRQTIIQRMDVASARTAEFIRRWFVPPWVGSEHLAARCPDYSHLVVPTTGVVPSNSHLTL